MRQIANYVTVVSLLAIDSRIKTQLRVGEICRESASELFFKPAIVGQSLTFILSKFWCEHHESAAAAVDVNSPTAISHEMRKDLKHASAYLRRGEQY